MLAQWKSLRLVAATVGTVDVTDEEAEAYYLENYVEPDRLLYEGQVEAFENDVLYGDNVSCWIPVDYRLVQWILIPYTDDACTQIEALSQTMLETYQAASDAYDQTFGLFSSSEERTQAQETYQAALDAYMDASSRLSNKLQEAMDEVRPTLLLIAERYNNGESFDTLITEYSSDQSTLEGSWPIRSGTTQFVTEYVDACMNIAEINGLSDPLAT